MKNKNIQIALMTVIVFIFVGVIISPIDIVIKLVVGCVLAASEGGIVYKLNLFDGTYHQKVTEALNIGLSTLNTLVEKNDQLVECMNQQGDHLASQIEQMQQKIVSQMKLTQESTTNRIVEAQEKVANQIVETQEKLKMLNEQGQCIEKHIIQNHAKLLQEQKILVQSQERESEKLLNEVKELIEAVGQQEKNMRSILELVSEEQKQILVQILNNYESINSFVQDKQDEVVTAFENSILRIEKSQEKYTADLSNNIEESVKDLEDTLSGKIKELNTALNNSQRKFAEKLQDQNDNLTEDMGKTLNKHLGNIEIAIESMLKQYEDIKIYIETLQNGLIDLNEKDIEVLKKYFG